MKNRNKGKRWNQNMWLVWPLAIVTIIILGPVYVVMIAVHTVDEWWRHRKDVS